MILDIYGLTVEEEIGLIAILKEKGVDVDRYTHSWECYITNELKCSVPTYLEYEGLSEEELDSTIAKCIDRALNESEYLISGEDIANFIDGARS